MANTLLTINMITNEALRILENNLTFAKQVNREYDDRFGVDGAKIGYTLNVRKPVKYIVTSGPALTVQDITETSVPVTLTNQDLVAMEFTTADRLLSIDDFSERIIKPSLAQLANQIDKNGLLLANQVPNTVGDPTKVADTLRVYLKAGAYLDNESAPMDGERCVVVGPLTQAGLVDNLKGLFQSSTQIAEQYEKGQMGIAAGFDWYMDQNVTSHTFGPAVNDPIIINGANQSGNSLVVSGMASTNNLKAGDTFTIAGVFAVNQMSKQSTGYLRQFVVLNDTINGATQLSISPAIVATGPYQNVTALPANGAALTFIGTAGQTVEYSLAFHKDAFTLACADLPLVEGTDMCGRASDDQLGLSIRLIRDYLPLTDQLVTRCEILYGWAVLRPELAVKIISNTSAFV